MVAVLHARPKQLAPQAIAEWLHTLAEFYSHDDVDGIERALAYAQEHCASVVSRDGEPMLERAMGTASILAGLRLDAASVRAALLVGMPYADGFDAKDLATRFGSEVADLVAGVARMDEIRAETDAAGAAERAAQAERLRKMLLAMVEDIRVVLIKLAERTQALRYLSGTDDAAAQKSTAREVLDLFAPLANRLGIWQLKWELEDLSLRALEPDVYKDIARQLDERRLDRQRYIENVMATLTRELANAGIRAEVTGRPKHIYSIWSKMRRKQTGIDAVYDIRAVRILVDDVKDCYAALGIVHNLWAPLPGEFDDYIAKPKANDYRSLHTAVIGPEGKPLEVQIRTFEMHQHSEFGVAAHWRYKESGQRNARRDPGFEDRIAWLRQVLDWKDSVTDASDWLTAFKSSLFVDTIYVLTPQGKVIDLPQGSTPVDFAYSVHTNLGHRCRGARVNGVMVPLNTPLRNGQQVEVLTVKQGGPSRDWLNPELGYVQSHRARTKVRQWFKAQQHEETVAHGRSIVERELQRAGATALNLDAVASQAGFARAEDLFVAAGREEINLRQLQTAIRNVLAPASTPAAEVAPEVATRESKAASSGTGILVVGVDRLMTVLARCCKPAPPDAIVGFVTRGKGVTIHRRRCANVARLQAREPERLIAANWGDSRDEVFPVDVTIEATDRQGLLRDITEVLSRERINVTAANTLTRNMQSRMAFTLEVKSLEMLQRALALIRELPGVLEASRR
ncbi:MAG TPA: bifunctional (p)ppGpp synthetase/guanosine-3',5'-bis(diphosphate) 3'-pyrophosphohydrolase [Casimicrobiaceae bacterium]|nr:bifunctional (p)ppGpp synthetase/guanosine-3',5'-bis(diphosphate) 3'-pyrophosphohydrolase [Casimicrobiaceae bacterium]